MNNLDNTLPQELIVANQLVNIDTEDILNGIYQIADAEAYKGLEKSQFADPANRAFPINSAARCRSAITYLVKYYNNKPSSGVTADYSDAKFKEVHNRIVTAMKKFGIEHGGCVICNKKPRKEASYMDKTEMDVVQAENQEPVAQEEGASESTEVVEETQASAEEATEEVVTSEESAESDVSEEATESDASADNDESGSRISVLESEMACLKDELSKLELKHSRLRRVDKAGIEITDDLESTVLALDSAMFERFLKFLEAEQASATPEADVETAEEGGGGTEPSAAVESASEEETEEAEASDDTSEEASEEASDETPDDETASVDIPEDEADDKGPVTLNLESAAGSRRAYYRAIFAK